MGFKNDLIIDIKRLIDKLPGRAVESEPLENRVTEIACRIAASDTLEVFEKLGSATNAIVSNPITIPRQQAATPLEFEESMEMLAPILLVIDPQILKSKNVQNMTIKKGPITMARDGNVYISPEGTVDDIVSLGHEIGHIYIGREVPVIFDEVVPKLFGMLIRERLRERGYNFDSDRRELQESEERKNILYTINSTIGMCKEVGLDLASDLQIIHNKDKNSVSIEAGHLLSKLAEARRPKDEEAFEKGYELIQQTGEYDLVITTAHQIGTNIAIHLYRKIQRKETDLQSIVEAITEKNASKADILRNLGIDNMEKFVGDIYDYVDEISGQKNKNIEELEA